MLLDVNIRFQIAAILVVALIIADYAKNRHLHVRSAVEFIMLLSVTAIDLLFDVGCAYCDYFPREFSPITVKVFHDGFFFTLVLAVCMESLYIRTLTSDEKKIELGGYVHIWFPLIGTLIYIILREKIHIWRGGIEEFYHGPSRLVVYLLATIYIIQESYYLSKAKAEAKKIDREARIAIITSQLLWVGVLIAEFLFKVSMSGLMFTLMVLVIYFSYENQKDNVDAEIGCFNKNAFNKTLNDYYANNKQVYLVNITIVNYYELIRSVGRNRTMAAIKEMFEQNLKSIFLNVYRINSNTMSILWTGKPDTAIENSHKLDETIKNSLFAACQLESHFSFIDLKRFASDVDEVEDIIEYMHDHHSGDACEMCILDDEIMAMKKRHDTLHNLLDHAIETDNFTMVFQPIYDTTKKAFTSAEALIRMKDCGDLGFVSPEEFIPMAEEKGLILDIGDLTVRLVAQFAKETKLPELGLEYIEINLSALQAVVPNLDQRLSAIVEEYDLPPKFINWEITETAMVDYGEDFEANMHNLRKLGYSFSMDDFGTGYSNLAQMNEIHYDLVKIDKSLIWPAFDEKNPAKDKAKTLLHSVINMLHDLKLGIVAEGVETKEMVDYLEENGVEHLQGYFYSKPVSGDRFVEFIMEKGMTA